MYITYIIVTDIEGNTCIRIYRLPMGRGTDQWKWYCPSRRRGKYLPGISWSLPRPEWIEIKGCCSFWCYRWNCRQLLFKLSFHRINTTANMNLRKVQNYSTRWSNVPNNRIVVSQNLQFSLGINNCRLNCILELLANRERER